MDFSTVATKNTKGYSGVACLSAATRHAVLKKRTSAPPGSLLELVAAPLLRTPLMRTFFDDSAETINIPNIYAAAADSERLER